MMRVSFGSPDLTCSVCIQQYDLQLHKPMVLCLNMHTICLDCAKKTKSKQCPFCKRKYQLKDLVPNRYVLQQVKTKFPDMRGFNSENQISNSQSQKVSSSNNQFNGGYFNPNQGNFNNNNANNDINPYQANSGRQNNMARQINQNQNLGANYNAVIIVNRGNNIPNDNRNQNNQMANNHRLNPVQPLPQNQNGVKSCCLVVTILALVGLAVYFVTQGQDYYGGAAACSIAAICGCISIMCKNDQRNQRDVYIYQPNR